MKETILSIFAILCCVPILVWIFRAFVIDPYEEEVKRGGNKDRALGNAIISGVVVVIVLAVIVMCHEPTDPEKAEKWDEYVERREPGW